MVIMNWIVQTIGIKFLYYMGLILMYHDVFPSFLIDSKRSLE
jgi:hypothetical protein